MTYEIKQAKGDYELLVHDNGREYGTTPSLLLKEENGAMMSLNWDEHARVQVKGYLKRKAEREEAVPYDVAQVILERDLADNEDLTRLSDLIDREQDCHGTATSQREDGWKEKTPVPAYEPRTVRVSLENRV